MPIYDLSYRHWEGALRGAGWRWLVIAEAGIRLLLGRKRFLFLLMLSWVPFFIQGFILYITMVQGTSLGFSVGPWFFQNAFWFQLFPLILVTINVGSGLIANDLAANALPLYFSKPITRLDYVLGKFAVIAFFLVVVFLAPVFLLFVFAAAVSPDLTFIRENFWVIFSILGYGSLVVSAVSLFILGLSCAARSGRIVGLSFIAAIVFSNWMGFILSIIVRTDQVLAISLGHDLARISDAFFAQTPGTRLNLFIALMAIGLVSAWSAWMLSRRIRPVEVIG